MPNLRWRYLRDARRILYEGTNQMELLERLLEHDRWATTSILELCRGLADDQLDQEFEIGHRTLRETFAHMIYNVASWTGLMTGEREVAFPPDRSVPAFIAWDTRVYDTFATFARQIQAEGRFEETFVDAFAGPMTYGGAIVHVILHNEDHRTEVLHIVQRLGGIEVPELDHALWDYVRRGLYEPDA